MKIQISLSTRCNINCRFCLKESLKKNYGFIENIDMDENLAYDIVSKKYDHIQICGNRGEALIHPKINEIIRIAKNNNNIISFVTNASMKNRNWWIELAHILDNRDNVIFPIDGVGNKTHNMHRQSDFYIVLGNIEAFVNAGGKAIWRYIVFKHNEHQIDLAKHLAKEIGVEFVLLNSHTYDDVLKIPSKIETKSIKDNLYFPCDHQELYVNVKGYLFPCCFIANIFGNKPMRDRHNEKKLMSLYEKEMEMTNLKNNKIEYIIDNSIFFKECMKKCSSICKGSCYNWSINQR